MKNGELKKWCKAAGMRALKTVAETALSGLYSIWKILSNIDQRVSALVC